MNPAEVQSYEGLDPIESEMRRRIYWVSCSSLSCDGDAEPSATVPSRQEHRLLGMFIFCTSPDEAE